MVDRTVANRVSRQRTARLREGWQEVRVWVPTDEDAAEIRALAERKRATAETLRGLKEGVTGMDAATEVLILNAIQSLGSKAYNSPSGAVLTLLSELASRGDLRSFSNAFVIFARARPASAGYVEDSVPGKILNAYFYGHKGITFNEYARWHENHADWAERLKGAVRNPGMFELVVDQMLAEMRFN